MRPDLKYDKPQGNKMNYKRIHDSIIDRARHRSHIKGVHQRHHIIPLHEDNTSTETVSLTLKEHRLVHLLRYKFNSSVGNLHAYYLMSGIPSQSSAGKIGGNKTKERNSGIFSQLWNRSEETKRRWKEEILNPNVFPENHGSAGGLATKESKKGIFSDDYDRSKANRDIWNNLTQDQLESRIKSLRENAKSGGQKSKELGTNFTSWDPEKRSKVCALGGSIVGKIPMWTNGIENKRSHECPGEGWFRGIRRKKKNSSDYEVFKYKGN